MSGGGGGSGARARRRRPTRWVLVAAVGVLVAVLGGTELLLRAKPLIDTSPFIVGGLPPIAIEADPAPCRRGEADDAVAAIGAALAQGGRITSGHVYACPIAFDGRRVTYVGEPVGDLIRRRGGVWVHVNDDDYALEVGPMGAHREYRGFSSGLAVWLPDGLHEQIESVGLPGRRGDILLLEGVLHQSDPDDGGGITLRADRLEVLVPTMEAPEPLHTLQAILAAVAAVAAVTGLALARRAQRR